LNVIQHYSLNYKVALDKGGNEENESTMLDFLEPAHGFDPALEKLLVLRCLMFLFLLHDLSLEVLFVVDVHVEV
jgi:hypothetical protein